MNLGIVEAALGDASGSEASYVEAIALRKGVYPDAHYNLGTLYLSRGLKNQALQQFEVKCELLVCKIGFFLEKKKTNGRKNSSLKERLEEKTQGSGNF